MPAVAWSLSVPAGQTLQPNLAPYDRFGGGGGACKIRSSVPAAGAAQIQETVFIGSELIESAGTVGVERSAGSGPDNFTRSVGGIGTPGAPINILYRNLHATTAFIVTGFMDIENA